MPTSTMPSPSHTLPRIDRQRLWDSLMTLAELGATPKGGVNRQALTDLDRQARDLFIAWCREEGCEIRLDAIGNIFARRPGQDPDAAPVVAGSHIDTQPTGGKFDGCFGVLAGLEAIRTLNAHGIATVHPVEIAAWTNEEGCRFAPCMMGSGVFAGQLGLDDMLARKDANGVTVSQALTTIGYAGPRNQSPHRMAAYYEAHIEQGPILEDTGNTIGVVTGALGVKWFDLTLSGMEAHAGPTPMHLRRDALLGAAELIKAINGIALDYQPHARSTVGELEVFPNSRNVIPGQVTLSIDLRHLETDQLESMVNQVKAAIAEIKARYRLAATLTPAADIPPHHFDATCVNAVRQGAQLLNLSHIDMVSGAGHDAIFIAAVTSAAMIFVPCKDGISHNETEYATPDDLAAGCDVLLSALVSSAKVASA